MRFLCVLSLFVFLLFSSTSFGDETNDCRSYVKTPDWIICLSSGNGEKGEQMIFKNEGEIPLAEPTESVADNFGGPPDSAFFVQDENGEITDQPKVFNDFSDMEN